jgi:hypothetical protein
MSAALGKLCQSVWLSILAFVGFLLLTLLMTWPLAARLSTELVGAGTDVWVHQWTYWWVRQALLSGQNPFYTTLLYYPEGVSLTSHNIAWFNIALWLPLQALLGSVTSYNLIFILVLALNGFAFFVFAKVETGIVTAAFLGGLIFAFWPYTLSHNDHPNMTVTFWVPLTMYFMLRTFREARIRDAVLAGLCLALIGITRWQLLIMSAPILVVYALYLYYREPRIPVRRTLTMTLLSLGLGALLMAPLGAPLVLDQLGRSGPEAVAIEEPDYIMTDLLSYLMPPDLYRAIWNEIPEPLPYPLWEPYHRISAGVFYVPFIGLVPFALALYGLWRQWPQTWFWLLVALGIVMFALGPELTFNGERYPEIPLPYRALSGSLLDVLIRRPHRLNIFLCLPVAMMAAWGMADISAYVQGRWEDSRGLLYAALATLVLATLILWENPVPPVPTTNTAVPLWYRNLAEEKGAFALLELPFHNRGFDKLYMYYQTIHSKPILVGHVSRLPQEAFTFLDSIPFLEPFRRSVYMWDVATENWVDFEDVDVTRQLALLAEKNVRYIILNKALIAEGFVERWRDWATFEPAYEDDEVLVYDTSPQAGEDFTIAYPMADGIGQIRASLAPREANQAGIVKADVRWASDAQPAGDYQVCFYLKDDQGATADTFCVPPVVDWPTSAWGADTVARGHYVIPIAKNLLAGAYTVDTALAEMGEQEPVGEIVAVSEIVVAPFEPQEIVNLCWEDDLYLRGYDIRQTRQQLDLNLYWQSIKPPEESYKRFVHVIDPHDGRVVAQSDAIPRDWTYPTNIWEPGEIVVGRLSFQVEEIPPGNYELHVGWYAVDGEQPLKVCPEGDYKERTADFQHLTTIAIP